MRDQDANKPHNPSDLKRTDAGRPVYSGGGIEPDKYIAGPIEGFNPTPFGRMLYCAPGVRELRAEVHGRRRHARSRSSRPAAAIVAPNFVVDDAMIADFREQLKTDRIKIDEEAFTEGPRVHQGDDPLPDRRGGVRHRRGAAPSDRRRSAGAAGAHACSARRRSSTAGSGTQRRSTPAQQLSGVGRYDHNRLVAVVCPCPYS